MSNYSRARCVGSGRKTKVRSRGPMAKASRTASDMRVQRFAHMVWEALDTPLTIGLSAAASCGDWASVVRCDVDPLHYTDPYNFFLDYQAVKLISKSPCLPTGINTRKAAEKKFIEAEVQCRETNDRFRNLETRVYPRLARILHAAQGKISSILGDVPSLEALDLAFGPGASFGVRGFTTAFHKLTASLESTHSMITILPDLLGQVPGWVADDTATVTLVSGSDLSFVPKDAKTDRAICIEPLLNGFLQKGIGSFIRDRLRSHGINLNDQSVNQRLSAVAVNLGLSTVDFSSASDTIAYNLVWNLLPPDWCEFLDTARCSNFRYEGKWYPFQKFSSMGNAYTFELETLIFYALAYACCVEEDIQPLTGRNISVYGDDVIIPRGAFDLFKEVSEFCGFTLNASKSFKDGLFFESCGVDSFSGALVTPLRLKQGLSTTKEIFYASNFIVRLTERLLDIPTSDPARASAQVRRLVDVHRWLVGLLPRHHLVLGPYDEGDDWLICAWDRCCPPKGGSFGYRHRRVISSPTLYSPDDGLWPMSYALYSAYRSKDGDSEVSDTPSWSEGAALRTNVRTRFGWTWSSDWVYPIVLAGLFWQGY